jgi:hypothetical protein
MKLRFNLSTCLILLGIIALAFQGIKTGSHIARCRSKARDFAEAEQRCNRALAWELERPAVLRAELATTCQKERQRVEKYEAFTKDLLDRYTKDAANDPETISKLAHLEAKRKQRRKDGETFCARETARIEAKIRESRLWAETGRLFAAYHARMKAKYAAAAEHPWLAVPADEPMPTWTYRDLPQFQKASSPR